MATKEEMRRISVDSLVQSPTNTRGDFSKDPAFKELVKSVAEKGVLVPVLVRKMGDQYEVIAGNRRLAAAVQAEVKDIPARIVSMSDVEAQEAQIVENLQRADIHPLDEGEAYRQLIETSDPRYTTDDVAVKVGKSEKYVRNRLALTNLSEKGKKAYRSGQIYDTAAVIIAKLDPKLQDDVLKEQLRYDMSIERLQNYIEEKVYTDLANKPWAKDAKLSEMLGDKPEATLFSDKRSSDDPAEYARMMSAYIEHMVRKAEEAGEKMVKICTSWGSTSKVKGALVKDKYRVLHSKEDVKKSKNPIKGIVVEGDNLGRVFWVTTEKDELREQSVYKKTPEEKAKAKKEREASAKKAEKEKSERKSAIGRIKWPLNERTIDALVEAVFFQVGMTEIQDVCRARDLEVPVSNENGYKHRDYEKALRGELKKATPREKLQLAVELLVSSKYSHAETMKILKKF